MASRATVQDVLTAFEDDQAEVEWLQQQHTKDHHRHRRAHPMCCRCEHDQAFFLMMEKEDQRTAHHLAEDIHLNPLYP